MNKYKNGDRVIAIKDFDDTKISGLEGVIIGLPSGKNGYYELCYSVRFDEKRDFFHNCEKLCEDGYGFWVQEYCIELKEEPKISKPEKVKISKELARAIEKSWDINKNSECVVKHLYLTNWSLLTKEVGYDTCKILKDAAEFTPIEYMSAIAFGYDIDLTVDEEIFYKFQELVMSEDHESDLIAEGIQWTLKTLDKYIVGVSDCEINKK